MSLNCYVIDDEDHAISLLSTYIRKTPGLELIGASTDPLEALEVYRSGQAPELTFLDVDMPELNGLEFASLTGQMTKVVFTTSFREYAPEAFERDAEDYLLKPIAYDRFLKCIHKVQRTLSSPDKIDGHFFVKTGIKGQFVRVNVSDIRYIENNGNYIDIHTVSGKTVAYLTISEALSRLPGSNFTRVHQSFIVNHHFIQTLEHGQLKLDGGQAIPVGSAFREAFRTKISDTILISKRT